MEKYILNGIENKGKDKPMWVVNFDVVDGENNKQATLGHWQSQEADFLQKDVGIRGTFEALIIQNGQYTNIKEVNMSNGSYSKGVATTDVKEKVVEGAPKQVQSDVQKSIEAQMMFKTLTEFGDLEEATIDKAIKAFNYIKERI